MNETVRTRWFLLAILFIALLAAWPELAQPGLLNTRGGGDSPFLLQRLHQLETAVYDGHFPVRWMPDANYGYGYPFYNFYAPLSIYSAFLFRLIGFSFVRAIHLSHLLGYIAAAWATFALVRRWFGIGKPRSSWAGLLAAAAYTVAPFHLANVYVRGDSLAEFWAMAFYPLVILAADGLFGGGRRQIALFALAYAALILSHNISALIFSPFLLLYLVLKILALQESNGLKANIAYYVLRIRNGLRNTQYATDTRTRPHPYMNIFVGLMLALALAAWFFAPALAEQSLAQLDTVTSGYFHYSNHFLAVPDHPLVQSSFFVDYGVVDREAFRMGLVQTAVLLTGMLGLLWFWYRQRKVTIPLIFIGATLMVSTVMLIPLSTILWEHLPLLSFTQFPWRFLSVQAFAGALAVGALAMVLPKPQWWLLPLIGLLLFSSLGQLKTDYLPITDADVTAESLAQYEWFSGNIGTTISFEYLPPSVQPRPYTSRWLNNGDRSAVTPLSGELVAASLLERGAIQQRWEVETAVSSTLTFPTLHWAGWQGLVDGEVVAIRPSAGSGLIELDVPAGAHEVLLQLRRTPIRLGAEIVSLMAILLTIWLLKPSRSWLGRQAGMVVVALLLLAVGLRLWPDAEPSTQLKTWDFVQMGYLHPNPDGVSFSSGAVLTGATLPQTAVPPGEIIRIVLSWQAPPAEDVTVSLYSPAINWQTEPSAQPPPIAQQTLAGNTAQILFELTLPENVPAGLFVPQLTLANGRPLTQSGKSRNVLFLQPIRIAQLDGEADEQAQLTVRAIDAKQIAPDELVVQLAWYTPKPIGPNYNVALRLTDAQGRFLRLMDTQPGYGFLPSSGWPAGEWVNDWLTIPLPPADEGHERPFVLVAQLIDVVQPNAPVLTRRLGELVGGEGAELTFGATEPQFVLPEGIVRETAVFGEEISLQGYRFDQTVDEIDITFVWQALINGQTGYTRFVHLIDPATGGAPVVQIDSQPRYGSYPTSQWTAGEVVEDSLVLPLAGVPPGSYHLAIGFYSQPMLGEFERLLVQDGVGDGRFILPIIVDVPE